MSRRGCKDPPQAWRRYFTCCPWATGCGYAIFKDELMSRPWAPSRATRAARNHANAQEKARAARMYGIAYRILLPAADHDPEQAHTWAAESGARPIGCSSRLWEVVAAEARARTAPQPAGERRRKHPQSTLRSIK